MNPYTMYCIVSFTKLKSFGLRAHKSRTTILYIRIFFSLYRYLHTIDLPYYNTTGFDRDTIRTYSYISRANKKKKVHHRITH